MNTIALANKRKNKVLAYILLPVLILASFFVTKDKKVLPENFIKAKVSKHVDGDTVWVILEDGEKYKLRFIGINTPETVHPNKPVEFYGKEASDFTKKALLGKTIYLEKDVSDTDRYGRMLRYIWLEIPKEINEKEIKDKMFNAILLIEGYAQVSTYPPDVKYQDFFVKLMQESKEKEIGLWSESNQ